MTGEVNCIEVCCLVGTLKAMASGLVRTQVGRGQEVEQNRGGRVGAVQDWNRKRNLALRPST